MTMPRSVDLQWQQEVIERWLNTPNIPSDAREGLLDLLNLVNQEMENLKAARGHIQH